MVLIFSFKWYLIFKISLQFSSVQLSLSRVRLFATPWIAARQASLSITNSRSSLKLTSIESVMPSSHLILCCPLLLPLPIPPSIRVFSFTCREISNGFLSHSEWNWKSLHSLPSQVQCHSYHSNYIPPDSPLLISSSHTHCICNSQSTNLMSIPRPLHLLFPAWNTSLPGIFAS